MHLLWYLVGTMKKQLVTVLALTSILCMSCGGDDKKTTSSSNTDGSSTTNPSSTTPTSKGSLTVTSASPVQANGDLTITSVVDAANSNAYGRVITVTAAVGESYSHEIKIYYSTYFQAGKEYGTIQSVIDTWGSDLTNPDGISVCEADCTQTTIYPETASIVFNNQYLGTAPEISVVGGVVLYTTTN